MNVFGFLGRDRLPAAWMAREAVRRLARPLIRMDDFDWRHYHEHYRAEFASSARLYTHDLSAVDVRIVDGRLYLLADTKPLHPNHRCLWEAILNLPNVASVGEVGVGGGYLLAGVGRLLGPGVRLSGYDLSAEQLRVFSELMPEVYNQVAPSILDITEGPISSDVRPDVVYAHTVLMHIQRPDAYVRALANLLASGSRYAVILDHWVRHEYATDLTIAAREGQHRLYYYDSGSRIALVLARTSEELGPPYQLFHEKLAVLEKY